MTPTANTTLRRRSQRARPRRQPRHDRSRRHLLVVSSGGTVGISSTGSSVTVTADGTATSHSLAAITSIVVTGSALTIDLSGGAITTPITFTGTALTVSNSTSASDWTINGDGTGTVTGGGLASLSFSNVTQLAAGGPWPTRALHAAPPPTSALDDQRGPGSGEVALAPSFSGFENLTGAANNRDTFNVLIELAGSVSGLIDGRAGGYDTLEVGGQCASVVSNPE